MALGWDEFVWADLDDYIWADTGTENEAILRTFFFTLAHPYVAFLDDQGEVIGYRRPYHISRTPTDEAGGQLPVDTAIIEIKARTGFGDGYGSTSAEVALAFNVTAINPKKVGQLWLKPDEVQFTRGSVTDMVIPVSPLVKEFRRTVREHVVIRMEI